MQFQFVGEGVAFPINLKRKLAACPAIFSCTVILCACYLLRCGSDEPAKLAARPAHSTDDTGSARPPARRKPSNVRRFIRRSPGYENRARRQTPSDWS